jgi:uncharacterized surface protein with fasciclin (FAS1) repeats
MMKKLASALATLALSVSVAACGSSSSSQTTQRSTASTGTGTSAMTTAPMSRSNIVQTAIAAGEFKTLVSLVKQAGLVGALSSHGPLTVFAPTDAAFAAVPKATLAELAKDKAKLKAVLLNHVVKGDVTAAQVTKLSSAKTLDGSSLPIRVTGGTVYVDGARVTKANIKTSNGVIHVINKVLVPSS